MAKIVIELTNRCNLSCGHCFSGRHGGRDDLSVELLERILEEARPLGFDVVSFTGGEPTIHREFGRVIELTCSAGYRFGCVSNGAHFSRTLQALLAHRDRLDTVTFSVDGATEATHDRLRGAGSFRRVMQAISTCFMRDIPFSMNMAVTAHNQHELERMVECATRLGSRGVRFGHLMPSPLTTAKGLDLSPMESKRVDAEIWSLQDRSELPVAIAPGHHTTDLFPCAPLHMQEVNIDAHGRLGKCCHLSGHGEGAGQADVVADLHETGFVEAFHCLVRANEDFHREKKQRLRDGDWRDSDFFPCWYCSVAFEKVGWLRGLESHPWSKLIRWLPLQELRGGGASC
ncbi:MAG: radical SAM protein [bacterium]|nr:radical SAM protein [bacterium]